MTQAAEPARPKNPLDGLRAFRYLQQICAIGPRPSGSPGMQKQQELVQQHFEKLGGKVTLQQFHAANPLGGAKVPMANMIVEWHPERKERILLCAHYDTRPLPDRDPDPVQRRSGMFIGANDGASGVAVLMELGPPDAEVRRAESAWTFCWSTARSWCTSTSAIRISSAARGSPGNTSRKPPEHKYRWGVVLDMVGDENLQIYQEQHSVTWRDTRPLVKEIWATAARLGVEEFIPRARYVSARRPPAAAQHRQDSHLRHHRFRLSSLAHDDGYAAALLAGVAGQGGMGRV